MADHLKMPSLTQVIKMDVEGGKLRCERQAEYGYDTVEVELPAVISVGDAINEPRYPSLKAIMGAKKKPLDTKGAGDVGIEADKVGSDGSRTAGPRDQPAAGEAGRADHRGRGHRRDGPADRLLARGKEAAGMSGILTYVLHYEGEFNKNSLGAVSEAAKLAGELGVEAHAVRGRRRRHRRPLQAARQLRRVEGLRAHRPPRGSGRRSST